jgi:hypothetical protein
MGRDDYSDPGPYKNPQGTVAYEIETPQSDAPRQDGGKDKGEPQKMKGMKDMKMKGKGKGM